MSFLDHLDELRRRLVRSIVFVVVVFMACWFVSDYIYNFLARPVRAALAEAQRRQLPWRHHRQRGRAPAQFRPENDIGRYVFADTTKLGASVIPGRHVGGGARRARRGGQLGLFTDEPSMPEARSSRKGVRLPFDLNPQPDALPGMDDRSSSAPRSNRFRST
jgi:sec-independent protein translocase protein TatC